MFSYSRLKRVAQPRVSSVSTGTIPFSSNKKSILKGPSKSVSYRETFVKTVAVYFGTFLANERPVIIAKGKHFEHFVC